MRKKRGNLHELNLREEQYEQNFNNLKEFN